jgi:hypothetical protein
MSVSGSFKRFPAQRRRACVPVTSARPDETEKSQQACAAEQASGDGAPPEGSALVPVDLKSRGSKE